MNELFTYNDATTTVSTGGTDAPTAGTSETLTVASSSLFPAAATGVSQFHVADPAASTEVITVTNVSGTTWTVTRGAENTTPVTHTAGYTVVQVITAGFLTSLAAANALNSATTVINVSSATAPAANQVLTATSSTAATWQAGAASFPGPTVPPSGAIAETGSRATITSGFTTGFAPTSGTPVGTGIWLNAGITVSNITFYQGGTAEAGGTHLWYALTDAATNTVRAVTADNTGATYFGAEAKHTIAVGTPYIIPASAVYYLVFCAVATTMPTLVYFGASGMAQFASDSPFVNWKGPTGQTTPPSVGATTLTPTSSQNSGVSFYAYVS